MAVRIERHDLDVRVRVKHVKNGKIFDFFLITPRSKHNTVALLTELDKIVFELERCGSEKLLKCILFSLIMNLLYPWLKTAFNN